MFQENWHESVMNPELNSDGLNNYQKKAIVKQYIKLVFILIDLSSYFEK